MARSWLLTSTTYGTWLPGDRRGFVGTVRDYRDGDEASKTGKRTRHNTYGTELDREMDGLRRASEQLLKTAPIWLSLEQAVVAAGQFRETARYRGWQLHALAVMANHFHIVVTAPEQTPSTYLLRDFKGYAARALNKTWEKPASGTWWTESGSRRPLPDERAVASATRYIREQFQPLVVWVAGEND
jgi:REP element-mobilizing transposase RayT